MVGASLTTVTFIAIQPLASFTHPKLVKLIWYLQEVLGCYYTLLQVAQLHPATTAYVYALFRLIRAYRDL
jgi:hypothetical protein